MDSGVKGEVAEPAGAASGSLHKRKRESRVEEKEEDVVHIEAKDLVDENTELSFAVMSKLLKEMKNHEFSEPFMEPVSVDEAPGYLNVVKRPMDFRTLGKQLKAGNFTTGKGSFIGSMRLIWRNCFAYNDPDSEIYQWAAILERKFEELLEESVASSTVALPASIPKQVSKKPPLEEEKLSDPMPVAPARKKKKGEGRATASALSQLLREISSDPRATPFLYPVDPSQAPGYLEIIKEPMDLSLISSKIGIYEDAPVELLRDLNLMLDNCQEYNTEESDIYQSVEPYRAFIHAKFSTFCEAHHLEVEMSDSVHLRKGQALYEMNVLPPVPPPPSLSTKALDPSLPLLHRVEADVAAYSLRNPVRAETTNQTLSLTVADADRLLDELLADDNGGSNSYVKLKAFQIASKLLNTTPLPFSHAMYTVKNFGYLDEALATKGNMVLDGVIVPNGYQCSTCLRLTATVSTGRRKTIQHDVDVQVVSFVTYRDQKPLFAVALVDGVTISSASHPREVWLQFLEETPNIVLHLGSKLRRCRAVLNRLCIHPLVTPFLERIDPYSAEGKEYYRDIRAPMWLSEVHKRLVEGAYNSEFEFMFDVRLVFANCMGYNTPDSTLYQSASALLADFEVKLIRKLFSILILLKKAFRCSNLCACGYSM